MITLSELCDGTLQKRYAHSSTAHIGAAIKERLPQAPDHTMLSLGNIAVLPTEFWPTWNVWDVADRVWFSKGLDHQTKCKIAHILTTSLRRCIFWLEAIETTKPLERQAHFSLRCATDQLAHFLSDNPQAHHHASIGSISYTIKHTICLHWDEARKQALKQDELERLHIIQVFPPIHLA